jgi:hypothetical protein
MRSEPSLRNATKLPSALIDGAMEPPLAATALENALWLTREIAPVALSNR